MVSEVRCIAVKWPTSQMADDHLGWSQMAGLLRSVMTPGLESPPWSTH